MKTHILTIMSLSFAFLLLTRAVQVSSEVVPDKTGAVAAEPAEEMMTPAPHDTEEKCLTGATYDVMIADLERLDKREQDIAVREKSLAAIETKLTAQLASVEEANSNLEKKIGSLKTVANDDLKHLVGMYQTMKPKQAAAIFNSMDPAFAAGFLREMSSDNAGLIMANMDARKSYTISVIIAGRNAKYR